MIDSESYSEENLEYMFCKVAIGLELLQVVIMYKAQTLQFRHLKAVAEEKLNTVIDESCNLVILGVFNIDVSQTDNSLCKLIERHFRCKKMIKNATTEYNTIKDLVFTNCKGMSGVSETFWSDHKLVYFKKVIV